jgi:hypothetical protein
VFATREFQVLDPFSSLTGRKQERAVLQVGQSVLSSSSIFNLDRYVSSGGHVIVRWLESLNSPAAGTSQRSFDAYTEQVVYQLMRCKESVTYRSLQR